MDVVDWINAYEAGTAAGPPPAEFLGGVAGIAPGGVNYSVVELEPGSYVWLCPMRDAPDQPNHLEHGMFLPFEVS